MVHDHTIANFQYLSMHPYIPFLSFFRSETPRGVELPAVTHSLPPVRSCFEVVIRVDDGKLIPVKPYPAKRVPVAKPPIDKHRQDGDFFKPVWDFDYNFNHGLTRI
jgi:hypothetical protein